MVKKEAVIFSLLAIAVLFIAGCQSYLNKDVAGAKIKDFKGIGGDYNGDGCIDAYVTANGEIKGEEGEMFIKYFGLKDVENADVDANSVVDMDDYFIFADFAGRFKCEKFPDIVVKDIDFYKSGSELSDDEISIRVIVTNIGKSPYRQDYSKPRSETPLVRITNLNPSEFQECTVRYGSVDVQGTNDGVVVCKRKGNINEYVYKFPKSFFQNGIDIEVENVDAGNVIEEYGEGEKYKEGFDPTDQKGERNNHYKKFLTLELPDFVVDDIEFMRNEEVVNFKVIIRNIGNAAFGSGGYYAYSEVMNLDPSKYSRCYFRYTESLNPGETYEDYIKCQNIPMTEETSDFDVSLFGKTGSKRIQVVNVESSNFIHELSESNNGFDKFLILNSPENQRELAL